MPSTLLLTIKLAVFEFEAIGGEILCAGNHLCIDMNEIPSIVCINLRDNSELLVQDTRSHPHA